MGKDLESCLLALSHERKYHAEAQQLLVELSDRRILFDDIGIERPKEVNESMIVLRAQLTGLQSRIGLQDTTLKRTLVALAGAIRAFLASTPSSPETIVVTSGDPRFEAYRSALEEFRKTAAAAVRPVAQEQGAEYGWMDVLHP